MEWFDALRGDQQVWVVITAMICAASIIIASFMSKL